MYTLYIHLDGAVYTFTATTYHQLKTKGREYLVRIGITRGYRETEHSPYTYSWHVQ